MFISAREVKLFLFELASLTLEQFYQTKVKILLAFFSGLFVKRNAGVT